MSVFPNKDHDKGFDELFNDIIHLIQSAKKKVSSEVNSTVVLLYWSIGKRINEEVLKTRGLFMVKK